MTKMCSFLCAFIISTLLSGFIDAFSSPPFVSGSYKGARITKYSLLSVHSVSLNNSQGRLPKQSLPLHATGDDTSDEEKETKTEEEISAASVQRSQVETSEAAPINNAVRDTTSTSYPINLPSPILLAASMVLAIASIGKVSHATRSF